MSEPLKKDLRWIEPQAFIDEVRATIRAGYGLVPFVGSGVSSSSGILMGQQFTEYLTWTVYACIVGFIGDPNQSERKESWDLNKKGWPPTPSAEDIWVAKSWVQTAFSNICDSKYRMTVAYYKSGPHKDGVCSLKFKDPGGMAPPPPMLNGSLRRPLIPDILRSPEGNEIDRPVREFWRLVGREEAFRKYAGNQAESPTSRSYLTEAAIRALADWRSSLEFLARLQAGNDRLYLNEIDHTIIDSFNTYITRGRKPN